MMRLLRVRNTPRPKNDEVVEDTLKHINPRMMRLLRFSVERLPKNDEVVEDVSLS
jgi:hypothetical protein